MFNNDYKITNDLKIIKNEVEIKYRNVSFDKALPILREQFNELADKYNTTNVDLWNLFLQMGID